MNSISSYAYASDANYDDAHARAVVSLVFAGLLSGIAVLTIFMAFFSRFSASIRTQAMPYFVSLLVANIFQSIGSAMNAKWIADRAVVEGGFCRLQGGIKQAGNVGMALWSFVLSVHIFNILFMRNNPSFIWRIVTICAGWSAVAFIVASGPLLVQSEAKGPYFGPSGYWCWITDNYPREQTFLEYFFEWLSAGFSFIIYIAILLRVRGNLVRGKDGWHIRYVSRSQRWQLAINRDWLDSTMMQVAARMVWYPASYSILLIPISLSRLVEFGGGNVPFWATILSDTLFNLQGFVNAILLFTTHRLIPDPATLPAFSTRKVVDLSSPAALGITPFVLSSGPPSQTAPPPVARISNDFHDISLASPASFDSQTLLIREKD